MFMGSMDPVDWWDTPLLNELGQNNRKTDSFTGRHTGSHQIPHHRERHIVSKD